MTLNGLDNDHLNIQVFDWKELGYEIEMKMNGSIPTSLSMEAK